MGNTTGSTASSSESAAILLSKLQDMPYNDKVASIKEIQNSDEWKEWIRFSDPTLVLDLLLQRDYFASKQVKTYHIACAFLALLEIFNPASDLVRKKRKREIQLMDPTIVQAYFYLILNKYLSSNKLLRSSLGTRFVSLLTFGSKQGANRPVFVFLGLG